MLSPPLFRDREQDYAPWKSRDSLAIDSATPSNRHGALRIRSQARPSQLGLSRHGQSRGFPATPRNSQNTVIGPDATATIDASDIVFYVAGINGNNVNLGATPKAAQIGLSNTANANFYVPNGTLWIRQNAEATGAFLGKDVIVGIGASVKLDSAF